jgi:hypothetical protein
MFSLDTILIEFFKNNILSVTAVFMILNGLAQESSWTWDEKIVNVLKAAIFSILPNKK